MENHKRLLRLLTATACGILILTYFAFPAFSGTELSSTTPNSLLNGEYEITSQYSCVYTIGGDFADAQSSFRISGGPYFQSDQTTYGVWSFDGNGTYRVNQGHTLATSHSYVVSSDEYGMGSSPIAEAEYTCDGSYTVDPENTTSFTLSQIECSGEYPWPLYYDPANPDATPVKRTFTSQGITGSEGRIANNGSTLYLRVVKPHKGTLTVKIPYAFSDPVITNYVRICNSSGTGSKLSSVNNVGDINGDGSTNVLDAIKVLRISLGLE